MADSQRHSALAAIEIPAGNKYVSISEQSAEYLMQINGAPVGTGLAPVLSALGFDQTVATQPTAGHPGAPALTGDNLNLLWNGPGMWFAIVQSDAAMQKLGASFEGTDATLTDLTDARTLLRLSGLEAETVLSKGCPVDFESMPANSVVSSHISHINALIHKIDSNTYDLYAFRSFGVVLYEWLTDAATQWASS